MPYVTLNPETRKMTLPDEYRHFGVESDEKSKRIEFKFPRFVDDIDLNDFNLYINYSNANNEKGLSIAEDVVVLEDEITFAWILSRHVTEYKGNVNFIVCAKKTVGEFRVQNEWNTRIATADVEQGLEVHHLVESMSADAINKLMSDLLALEPIVEMNTQARHTHPNKTVLDLFGDVSGNLYYRGRKVSDDRVDEIIDLIPEEASEDNQLADKEFTENAINEATQLIRSLIPVEASTENQLADKAFVNDSISTNSAYFRGTFNSLAELQAYSGPVTNNDYAYVIINDPSYPDVIKSYQRYKYSINQWLYEYEIALHDLTPGQLAALNSGATSEKIQSYDAVVTNTAGYGKIDGDPAFSGNKIQIAKKEVKLLPFNQPVDLIVNPKFFDVPLRVDSPEDTGDGMIFNVMAPSTKLQSISLFHLNNVDGTSLVVKVTLRNAVPNKVRYLFFDGDLPVWYTEFKEEVEAPDLTGVSIDSFVTNYSSYDSLEDLSRDKTALEAYKTFCRLLNISTEDFGDIDSSSEVLEIMKVSNSYYLADINKEYKLTVGNRGAEIFLPVPDETRFGIEDNAKVVINITKISADADIGIYSATGLFLLVNGKPLDMSEVGDYRLIATWSPKATAWRLGVIKFKEET